MSTELALRFEENAKQLVVRLQQLNLLVLSGMAGERAPPPRTAATFKNSQDAKFYKKEDHKQAFARKRTFSFPSKNDPAEPVMKKLDRPYEPLDRQQRQIRLFSLNPQSDPWGSVQGSFLYADLESRPEYIALSYTWGDPTDLQEILIDNSTKVSVRKNLWEFLQVQASAITEPKVFWIDAICIDQSDVHERNHQVGLMKDIYQDAEEVYIWLGKESDNSDVAMEYLEKKGTRKLRQRGPGYFPVWNRGEGWALVHLCERPYWRRMWVIQEIVHAQRLRVWCGTKSFEWSVVEHLYLTLKTLEDETWWAHHECVMGVLQSSAAIMVWQRAHWRHPETSTPRLQMLIEVFRDWQCSDVRDKVFALVNMASKETAIVPDYGIPARDVYFSVRDKHPEDEKFDSLLSQILGLSSRDIKMNGRDLIEYKVQPADRALLRRRCWERDYWND